MRTAVLLASSLLLAAGLASAGSQNQPEISDGSGDVAGHYWQDPGAQDGLPDVSPSTLQVVNHSADIRSAWISGESERSFVITIQVDKLPKHENISSALVDLVAHFTVKSDDYRAVASLAFPPEGGNLVTAFDLYRGNTHLTEIAGGIDQDSNSTALVIPKDQVRSPAFGDELTQFYATSNVPDTDLVLDYAPGAQTALDEDLFGGLGTQVEYGQGYTFGQYQGAVSPALTVTPTPSSLTVQAGDQGQVAIQVKNDAQQQDTARLTVGDKPAGWDVRISDSQLDVPSGQSKLTTLYVAPPTGASGSHLLTLQVNSDLGADSPTPIAVSVTAPPQQEDTGDQEDTPPADQDDEQDTTPPATGNDAGDAGSQEDGAEEESNGAPFVSPLSVLGLSATLAAWRRERGK